MKRALIISGVAAAAICASAAPAVAGLAGNASFSRQIPVPVPSGATPAQLVDDHGQDGTDGATAAPRHQSGSPSIGATDNRSPGEAEPGDDHGGDRTSGETEPGDDHGHRGSPSATSTPTSTPTNGRGGPGGSMSSADDNDGHGGSGHG